MANRLSSGISAFFKLMCCFCSEDLSILVPLTFHSSVTQISASSQHLLSCFLLNLVRLYHSFHDNVSSNNNHSKEYADGPFVGFSKLISPTLLALNKCQNAYFVKAFICLCSVVLVVEQVFQLIETNMMLEKPPHQVELMQMTNK